MNHGGLLSDSTHVALTFLIAIEMPFRILKYFPRIAFLNLRYALTENACILFENFENLILEDKFIFIMSNEEIQPFLAKTLYNMFHRRKYCLQ